jgi:multiple RNA-binding domain-containing protein 1
LDGSHRGFAFVEFLSHDEAMKAFKELQNTHFYGRKIVIEWAEKESTVESLREKTKRKANLIGVQTHKTQKKGEIKFK